MQSESSSSPTCFEACVGGRARQEEPTADSPFHRDALGRRMRHGRHIVVLAAMMAALMAAASRAVHRGGVGRIHRDARCSLPPPAEDSHGGSAAAGRSTAAAPPPPAESGTNPSHPAALLPPTRMGSRSRARERRGGREAHLPGRKELERGAERAGRP